MVLIFIGDQFIPEYPGSYDQSTYLNHPEYKYTNGIVGGTIRSGRYYFINGDHDYY